eukprot:scaffold2288_cov258-Pinguiococcus_pyrenoidosus.AAC.1
MVCKGAGLWTAGRRHQSLLVGELLGMIQIAQGSLPSVLASQRFVLLGERERGAKKSAFRKEPCVQV